MRTMVKARKKFDELTITRQIRQFFAIKSKFHAMRYPISQYF